jgi:hypothetical protein
LQEVLNAPGQIRQIDIATAYTDIEALATLFDLVAKRGDSRSGVRVRIFLDYQNACKLADELRADQTNKKNKKLYKELTSTELKTKNGTVHCVELFAVQLGTLFHSKAFVMKTNTHWTSCVGSVNFTTRGFTTNEEIAVIERIDHSEYKQAENLTKQVLQYLDVELFDHGRVERIPFKSLAEKRKPSKISEFRELFLEGHLWYEEKELTNFSFPLDLPNKVRNRAAEIQGMPIPHLGSKLDSGLPVLKLLNLDQKPVGQALRPRWKKFCIQTCLGLWASNLWTEYIKAALVAREEKRKAWLNLVTNKFEASAEETQSVICDAYDETWEPIQKMDSGNLRTRLKRSDLEKKAEVWVQRMRNKLATESFRTKLLTGVSSVEMPDLWGANPSDAKNFEESFFDHVEYDISRVSKQRSQIANNFLDCDITIAGNTRQNLVATFDKWGTWILGNYEEDTNVDGDEIEEDE